MKDALPPVPPLFQMLRAAAGSSWQEAYTVWNMGARLEAVVPHEHAEVCRAVAADCGIAATISGQVEPSDGPQHEVVIDGEHGRFVYAG